MLLLLLLLHAAAVGMYSTPMSRSLLCTAFTHETRTQQCLDADTH